MATSGTIAFNPKLSEIFEESYERAGFELVNGNDFKTAVRSFNFMMAEWANRGLNLWTIDTEDITLVSGTSTYTLSVANAVDLYHLVHRKGTGSSQFDTAMTRISAVDYSAIANKNQTGQPTQFWVDRKLDGPVINVWPVPSSADTLVVWFLRRVEDAGTTAAVTADIPFRFLPALVAGLSYHVSVKKRAPMDRVMALKQVYEIEYELAAGEDRDKSSFRVAPSIGRI